MDERELLAQRFEEHRARLRAVAYRMLGSLSEADDAVQEAWLRLSRTDADAVENLGGWLTTVVARVSLNMLRSRRSRREEPLDVRMPEPIVDRADGTDPEHEALLGRLGRPGAARRARDADPRRAARVRAARHVRRAVRRDRADRRPLARCGAPAREPRAPPRAGRGPDPRRRPRHPARGRRRLPRRRARGRLRGAARGARPGRGAAGRPRRRCHRRLEGGPRSGRRGPPGAAFSRLDIDVRPALVNGAAGTVTLRDGQPFAVAGFTVRNRRIVEMDVLADPERLSELDLEILD